MPGAKRPTRSPAPIMSAGTDVRADNAASADSPWSTALRRLAKKSLPLSTPCMVNAMGMPAAATMPGLRGAISQCFISSSETRRAR